MEKLSVLELHGLRLTIFENAKSLHNEAKVLHAHELYSRAYLLAHFCIEELGKLPLIVGAITDNTNAEGTNWGQLKKRFYSHIEKISSQNGHFYAFGLEADSVDDSGLQWLISANKEISETYRKKNVSTYVDVVNGKVLNPLAEISKSDSEKMLEFSLACLKAHEKSESLINPLIYEAKTDQ
jgi:AbiV family abortive infection protein